MKRIQECKRNAGFSLVELMVSVALGAILMAGATSIYLAAKRSYVEVEQVAGLSENASYAEQVLVDALRHTGFFGELPAAQVSMFAGTPTVADDCTGGAAAYDVDNFLLAVKSDSGGNAVGCIDDAVPGTDVLIVKHVLALPYSDGPRVADPNDVVARDGTIDTPSELDSEKSYVMTNDGISLLFSAGATVPSTISDVPNGVAWEYQFEAYYVKNAAVPYLSRKVLSSTGSGMELVTEDVVEGVENMRLLFGYDSNNDGEVDSYADAAGIGGNWDRVVSIDVYILVRSAAEDLQYEDEKAYTLGDITTTPGGNFRRLVSRASISLRNPKLVIRGGA